MSVFGVRKEFSDVNTPKTSISASAVYCSVVVTSPKHTLMVTLIGEVHSNFGSRNFVCRLLRIFTGQNINIIY